MGAELKTSRFRKYSLGGLQYGTELWSPLPCFPSRSDCNTWLGGYPTRGSGWKLKPHSIIPEWTTVWSPWFLPWLTVWALTGWACTVRFMASSLQSSWSSPTVYQRRGAAGTFPVSLGRVTGQAAGKPLHPHWWPHLSTAQGWVASHRGLL